VSEAEQKVARTTSRHREEGNAVLLVPHLTEPAHHRTSSPSAETTAKVLYVKRRALPKILSDILLEERE